MEKKYIGRPTQYSEIYKGAKKGTVPGGVKALGAPGSAA